MSEYTTSAPVVEDGPRQVNLAVARIDPWTVMKVSFLLSVALGIVSVIATAILWTMLDAMHVFSSIDEFLTKLGAERFTVLLDYVRFSRLLSYTTIAAVANVVLMTAIATVAAMLYNVIASLVGGVRVSLMDE